MWTKGTLDVDQESRNKPPPPPDCDSKYGKNRYSLFVDYFITPLSDFFYCDMKFACY